jgi:hypothetical protein
VGTRKRPSDGARSALSLGAALALHASLVGWAVLHEPPVPAIPASAAPASDVEVSLLVVPGRSPPGTTSTEPVRPFEARRIESAHPRGVPFESALVAEEGGEWMLVVPDGPEALPGEPATEPGGPPPTARAPRLSLEALGVSGAVHRSELMGLYREPPAPPDVGGLRRGLAARDAARGHGSSGAAVAAAHGAALARGPKSGTALFDVLVDGEGRVQSVTIVHARPDTEAWGAVARALTARLKGRRLRVPSNGNGVRTRIEVAIGDDARELQQRAESEPPVKRDGFRENAVGETRLPARTAHTESTREHIYGDPGVLSPTLGVGAPPRSGAKSVGRSRRVWVRVIGETQL